MTTEKTKEQKFLLDVGMINRFVYAGIQPDDCVVWEPTTGGFRNASICDHNCTVEIKGVPTGGNYTCDSSFSLHHGCKPQFAPRAVIVGWTERVATAHAVARDIFFQEHCSDYCERFRISPAWANAIRTELTSPEKKVEVNRFGGSPSMHPSCAEIVADCKDAGFVVNLTDPGRRLMRDEEFVKAITANPPHMLALSFDDISAEELIRIARMDLDTLKVEWQKVPKFFGQRQKAFEGFRAARLMQRMGVKVTILFNMVIHAGNVGHFTSLLDVLGECVPGALANPYPAQSFGNESPCWTIESLPALRKHIQDFIQHTLDGKPGITRRLHYYVALEAAFRKWGKNPARLIRFVSGIDAWDSTLRPGAYRYAQIGKGPRVVQLPYEKLPHPGGHLGCFWSPDWAFEKQVDTASVDELAEIMMTGVGERTRQLGDVRRTNIMPRLMFDVVATELGLPEELVDEYLATRREYACF